MTLPISTAVLVKFSGSVPLLLALASCSAPKEHPPSSASSISGATKSSSLAASPPSPTPAPSPTSSTAEVDTRPPEPPYAQAEVSSSAYFGCGEPIPADRLWDETSESQVLDAIGAAKTCAAAHDRRVLLEFVAPWCEDCREMAKLDETSVVAETLRERFERVRVNVGKWDRHEGLRNSYDVRALATYIVIDPKTSRQLAKTTLEPITKQGKKLSADDWARWLAQH